MSSWSGGVLWIYHWFFGCLLYAMANTDSLCPGFQPEKGMKPPNCVSKDESEEALQSYGNLSLSTPEEDWSQLLRESFENSAYCCPVTHYFDPDQYPDYVPNSSSISANLWVFFVTKTIQKGCCADCSPICGCIDDLNESLCDLHKCITHCSRYLLLESSRQKSLMISDLTMEISNISSQLNRLQSIEDSLRGFKMEQILDLAESQEKSLQLQEEISGELAGLKQSVSFLGVLLAVVTLILLYLIYQTFFK